MESERERLAVLESQGKWIAAKVDKIDTKLDKLLDAHWRLYGKVVGISALTVVALRFIIQ